MRRRRNRTYVGSNDFFETAVQYFSYMLSYSSVEPLIYFITIIIVVFIYSLKSWCVLKWCYIAKGVCEMLIIILLYIAIYCLR